MVVEPSDEPENPPSSGEVVSWEMAKVLREKSPAERLQIGFGMWRSAQRMLRSHLRATHPEWSGEKVDCEVAERLSRGSW